MRIEVAGAIGSNLGKANETLKMQLPLYPDDVRTALGNIHCGTINVQLQTPLIIRVESYDLDTGAKRIRWSEHWVPERFLFKKCKIRVGSVWYDAWIYRSSSTPNSIDPYRVEIISEFIQGVETGKWVTLAIDNAVYTTAVTF